MIIIIMYKCYNIGVIVVSQEQKTLNFMAVPKKFSVKRTFVSSIIRILKN